MFNFLKAKYLENLFYFIIYNDYKSDKIDKNKIAHQIIIQDAKRIDRGTYPLSYFK
jgi:hypothetical protein